nr:glycerophosphodiester phosphodiesterase [Spirochaetota bacterium]
AMADREAHQNGLCVHIYTVDRKWQFRLLHWFGADGFFTNRCELLMDYYDKAHKKSFKDVIVSIK